MSDDEWFQRLKKPRGAGVRRRRTSQSKPSGSLTVSSAEVALRHMLEEAGVHLGEQDSDELQDFTFYWNVFKVFAGRPVVGDGDEIVAGDDLLLECNGDSVDIVRQFSIDDADGDYDRMEQLHLTLWLDPRGKPVPQGAPLWGSRVVDWAAEVEQIFMDTDAVRGVVRVDVVHEQL